MNQPEEKKERRLNMIPSLDRDPRRKKRENTEFRLEKMFNQRLHSETSDLQRKLM
jgi:hypothetical protein